MEIEARCVVSAKESLEEQLQLVLLAARPASPPSYAKRRVIMWSVDDKLYGVLDWIAPI
ncbi:hypothetical protein C2845_PM11G04570 [Panicum miliaceum]|uniref:Uncharacterized protein n=1 Tax=Panicum miliaceum TaxID=4540 RepID=A0A3L6RPV7_PANMI|nr:hypothetical protein C2845_PM11G04570 [Panicum miliaceum]